MKKELILILALFMVFPVSCKKKGAEEELKKDIDVNLTLSKSQALGYEILTLTIEGVELEKEQYDLKIGYKTVKSVRSSTNTLDFIVPGDLESNTYVLVTPFSESKTIDLIVSAPANNINPMVLMDQFIGDIDAEFEKSLKLVTTEAGKSSLELAKIKLLENINRFNKASDEDKKIAAQVIEANGSALLEAYSAIAILSDLERGAGVLDVSSKVLNYDWEFYVAQGVKLLSAMLLVEVTPLLGAAGALVLGIDIGLSIITGKKSFLIAMAADGIKHLLNYACFPQIKYLGKILNTADEKITSGIKTMDMGKISVLKNEPFMFELQTVYRTMQREDSKNESYASLLKPFVATYDLAKEQYDKYFLKDYGPFPTFSKREEKRTATSLDHWAIKVLNSTDITVTKPEGSVERFFVKFNSTLKESKEFDFLISFSEGANVLEERVSAILVVPSVSVKIATINRNGVIGGALKKLQYPISIRVVDENDDKPLEGVNVQWTVKMGGGTVSSSETVTNGDGISETEWTLGVSGEQRVAVFIKNKDGSIIEGATAEFAMNSFNIVGNWNVVEMLFLRNGIPQPLDNGRQEMLFRESGTYVLRYKYNASKGDFYENDEGLYNLNFSERKLNLQNDGDLLICPISFSNENEIMIETTTNEKGDVYYQKLLLTRLN